jgi:TRAP-type transport system small permease protein
MKIWRDLLATLCCWLAAAALALMMLLVVGDVSLRAVINRPIRGSYEIVELLLTCVFFIALPAVFVRDQNIVVDLIDSRLPRVVPMLRRIAGVVAVVVLAVMAWQGFKAAQDSAEFGDVTSDLDLPRVLYWIPVLFGIVGAAIAAFTTFFWSARRR